MLLPWQWLSLSPTQALDSNWGTHGDIPAADNSKDLGYNPPVVPPTFSLAEIAAKAKSSSGKSVPVPPIGPGAADLDDILAALENPVDTANEEVARQL